MKDGNLGDLYHSQQEIENKEKAGETEIEKQKSEESGDTLLAAKIGAKGAIDILASEIKSKAEAVEDEEFVEDVKASVNSIAKESKEEIDRAETEEAVKEARDLGKKKLNAIGELLDTLGDDPSEEVKGNKIAYLLDGKGQGVWEDNKGSLMAYIDGEIKPESNKENERKGYHLPWNFNNTRYGDFDYYDIEKEKEFFDSNLIGNINDYLSGAHNYGFELGVKLLKETQKRRAQLYTSFGDRIDVEDLIITKTKTDLLSSLKNIGKEYAKKYMEDNCYDNYKEWKESRGCRNLAQTEKVKKE